MDVYLKLKVYYSRYWVLALGTIVSMVLAVAIGYARPLLIKGVVDGVIQQGHYSRLPWLALGIVGAAALRSCFVFGRLYLGHIFGADAVADLRRALYDKLQHMPFSYYDRARTGDLMSRLAGDVEVFRQFLAFGLANFAEFLLIFVMGLALMLSLDWRLTLVTLATTPALMFLVFRFGDKVHKAFALVRRSASEVNTAVQENLTGMRTVKSFARERQQQELFEEGNQRYRERQLGAAWLWAKYFPAMEFLSCLSVVLLIWYGSHRLASGALTIGGFIAFFNLIWYIVTPVQQLGFHINLLTQAIAGGERIIQILADDAMVTGGSLHLPPRLREGVGRVEFAGVSFTYAGSNRPAVNDVSFVAEPGSVIAVTGPTGSGKSTLASLIYRGYDAALGSITLDGVAVRDLPLAELRHAVSCVFQDTFLFSTTLRENIRYARRDATDAEVEQASRLAQAHDFIEQLPQGYGTLVGERGLGLSGGQKQRIAIARAILADPRVIIFDDATASVDMETEHAIQKGMLEAGRGRTVIIIAHRISSLKGADEILVLGDGSVTERGTHSELLSLGGRYSRIYDVQYGTQVPGAPGKAAM